MTEDLTEEYCVLYKLFPLRRPVETLEEGTHIIKNDPDARGGILQKRKATPWETVEVS